jgi:hypothetical protein
MILTCEKCNFVAKTPRDYNRHILTNKHQNRINNNAKHKCLCGKTYVSTQCLYRHRRKCNAILNNETLENTNYCNEVQILLKENQEMKERLKEMDELRKQVEMLIGNTGKNIASNNNSTINGNQNNIQHQQNVNITVNSFGSENIEHLTDQIICKLIKTCPFTCVPQLIEKIHFDPEHPENHNIKITNKKLNYAEIVKDNKWVTANKKKVIDDVIQKSYDILDEKYNDNKEDISDKRQERFDNFQDKFENEDESLRKNIKNDVDLLLINGTNEVHK